MKNPTKYYLVWAIIWTVIALAAFLSLFALNANLPTKFFGTVIVIMCVAGQWLRWKKSRGSGKK